MKLKKTPELLSFFVTYFSDSDPEKDFETARAYVESASAENSLLIVSQAKALLTERELPFDEFGSEANRWFADSDEARVWLESLVAALEEGKSPSDEEAVAKDSNGTVLEEGDSVQVIKDLKVKGGSSDLKRGTMIKKIHLIGDPENIECRVDGSTLVLKTCFLKKANL